MSESMFLRRNTNTFLAAHPREEGWMVYEFTSDAARKMYLHYLLDCLRDRHPDALKRQTALTFVEEDALRKSLKKSRNSEGATKDAVNEMDSFGWRGIVELVWNGHDIHCWMFSLVMAHGCADVYLVATKSYAAFQEFLLVLDQYGQARHKGEKREILVVNGENIPVAASSWEDLVLPAGMARDIRTNV